MTNLKGMNVLVYTIRMPSFRAVLLPCAHFAPGASSAASSVSEKSARSIPAAEREAEPDIE